MRSTNAGMPPSVVPISCSSSCAGTTTATRLPCSIAATCETGGDAVPHQRDDRAEHEADQGGDDDGVAAAACGHLLRVGGRQQRRLLDLARLHEQLARAQLVLLVVRQA